ncbi:hypothetical protein ED28_01155 [[Pantoea] beijingensis]|uniref:Uncharacterized protein n=1 Tax=[Pantoea] beijingensis TaxID=1324864 RepID=A0A443IHJ2_9GAMM|nr:MULTISPECIES: hypothetical protein [Erwiniaceae]RWR03624.1 hypothetical protein ED28_01155 [[Pantoea] beijingensis]
MSELFRKLLAAPGKMMQGVIRQDIQQSNNSKITTDANGNASLNMNNQHVRDSMRARMEELANNRQG